MVTRSELEKMSRAFERAVMRRSLRCADKTYKCTACFLKHEYNLEEWM